MAALIPIFIILCMQLLIRSFWDVNNTVIRLLYSLIGAAFFQVFLKWLIGSLRPHFLAVCKPQIPKGTVTGTGYKQIMYTDAACTGDCNEIDDALESYPSGHSTATFAGFIFLYLYLNAKLKVFANHHPAMWKLVAAYAPVLAATLIVGSLTIDEFHYWYNCVAGAIIGTMLAFSSYRIVYASVWDFRFNHIPLNGNVPFGMELGSWTAGMRCLRGKKKERGWGVPFDASALGGLGGGVGAHHVQGGVPGTVAREGFPNTHRTNGGIHPKRLCR